jgi:tRNA 2-thiouridine synthesizing protein A
MADVILDARGLSCPLPILKARRALRDLQPGATLEVLSTDPGSIRDFPAFCRSAGHDLLESSEADDAFCFVIRRGTG